MKAVKYKGVQVNKPDNISMNLVKRFIDDCGNDFSFSVDKAINFLSTELLKQNRSTCNN